MGPIETAWKRVEAQLAAATGLDDHQALRIIVKSAFVTGYSACLYDANHGDATAQAQWRIAVAKELVEWLKHGYTEGV